MFGSALSAMSLDRRTHNWTHGHVALIGAMVCSIEAVLVLRFRSLVNDVVLHKSKSHLVAALDSLRLYWIYCGVVLAVPLVFAGVILLFAVLFARALPFDWIPSK